MDQYGTVKKNKKKNKTNKQKKPNHIYTEIEFFKNLVWSKASVSFFLVFCFKNNFFYT